jgi:hypothetical protein
MSKDARDDVKLLQDVQEALRAHDAGIAAAIPQIEGLLYRVENGGESYDDVRAEMRRILDTIPPNPTPVTQAELDEAWALIHEMTQG